MRSSGVLRICPSLRHHAKKNSYNSTKLDYLGRPSNKLSAGIVGLANVGKSTLFQSITNSSLGNPANYPYATIEKEVSRASFLSPELLHLAKIYESKNTISSSLDVVDIAGLTRNSAKGEGLGNNFLADIRTVDGILNVVRAFRNDEIVHIEENIVNPVRDLDIVLDELLLKDLEFVETGVEKLKRDLKRPFMDTRKIEKELCVLDRIEESLYDGKRVLDGNWSGDEIEVINSYNFLTAKPSVFLVNVSGEDYICQSNEFLKDIEAWVSQKCPGNEILLFSAQYEKTLNSLKDDPELLSKYIGEHNNTNSAIPRIIDSIRDALHLISFYTCGEMEARQWTIRNGSTAPQAAGVIHTDLEQSFIHAQVYKYVDLINSPVPIDHAQLKRQGKHLRCGKNYMVENNDVLTIKATKGKSR